MIKPICLGVLAALSLTSCGPLSEEKLAPVPATSLDGKETAVVILGRDNRATGRYLVGPEGDSVQGTVFKFHSPWEELQPRQYKVAAGVVKFSLREGPQAVQSGMRMGFEAKAGNRYVITFDPHTGVAVEEEGTGRIARRRILRAIPL